MAKQQAPRQGSSAGQAKSSDAKSTAQSTQENDAISLLMADHRKVEALFERYRSEHEETAKDQIAKQIARELSVHTILEEEIFYPACRADSVEDELLDEAQVEHDGAKVLVAELMAEEPQAPYFDAKVTVLSEYIRHHVAEEEKPQSGIFARARAGGVDVAELGRQIQKRKAELTAEAGRPGWQPPPMRALEARTNGAEAKEQQMSSRYGEPDRDERGRFMSEDERGYRSRGGYSQRGREDDDYERGSYRGRSYGRDDDYEEERGGYGGGRGRGQGGWFGDPQGHSEASRQGWEDRGGYSSRGGGRSGRYEEDDNGGRGRGGAGGSGSGHGGWFGDPEGHSEASRRGWEERGYSSRGGRSGRYEEDDDNGGRGRGSGGHGGWFGDPEGHSEASRRGWEERGGGGRGGYRGSRR